MNDNVRKVFDMLGVEPNEKFKIEGNGDTIYYIDEKLYVYRVYRNNEILYNDRGLSNLIYGYFKIIKLPKTKKLRDLTAEEWDKWREKECYLTRCENCIFNRVNCHESENKYAWVNNKDIYSDKFLDQEIEVEE